DDLLEADLDLAAGNYGAHKYPGRSLLELVLDLVRQAQLFKQADHINAAWTRGISDRLCRQDGFLQRVSGADVGFGCAFRNADANPRFGYIDTAAGHDLASLYLRVDGWAGHNDHVVTFAIRQPLLRAERASKNGRNLVSRGLFELRH